MSSISWRMNRWIIPIFGYSHHISATLSNGGFVLITSGSRAFHPLFAAAEFW
ncbi:hypothetical protein Hanom_Chr09g00788811 [Helianthus anomalus]